MENIKTKLLYRYNVELKADYDATTDFINSLKDNELIYLNTLNNKDLLKRGGINE